MPGVTWGAVVKWFGKEMSDKMKKTGYLDGITCEMDETGQLLIPRSDIDRAYRAAKGEKIHPEEWD
jgi:hypothetical protein